MSSRSRRRSTFEEASSGRLVRQARLEHLLTQEIASILRDSLSDPALSEARVSGITLSPDGGHARVAFVVRGPLDEEPVHRNATRAAWARAEGFVRARLASQLNLKRTPKLTFVFVGMLEGGEE